MEKEEIYVSWNPIPDIPPKIISEDIHDDYNRVRIVLQKRSNPGALRKPSKLLEVVFDAIAPYRNIDESFRTKTYTEHDYRVGSLFIVENSKWVRWLHEESFGMSEIAERQRWNK